MRKFLISVVLASTVLTAAPAVAQRHNPARPAWNQNGPSRQAINELLRDLRRAESQIERSVQRRVISRREATGLRRDAQRVEARLNQASRNGISGREFAQLRVQVNRLEQRVRIERRDRDGRRN
ncbi:MAG TPA: hypothetical protein VK472_06750 [Allosphingosinicella sp.]|nr:hypothetical protein [Allosphingosinicella sp.]